MADRTAGRVTPRRRRAERAGLGGRGAGPIDALALRRLLHIGQLGGLGLVESLAVTAVAAVPSPGGTAALVSAGIAFAALAHITFGRATWSDADFRENGVTSGRRPAADSARGQADRSMD